MANFAIIGLGNPGDIYQSTRHNLGFWLLDKIAEKENVRFNSSKEFHADHLIMNRKEKKVLLVKPKTFMNESGRYLSSILNYFRCSPENVIVLHDDLTLPFGEIKISKNSSRYIYISIYFNIINLKMDSPNYIYYLFLLIIMTSSISCFLRPDYNIFLFVFTYFVWDDIENVLITFKLFI